MRRFLTALFLFTLPVFCQLPTPFGIPLPSGGGGITAATFASPPVSPATNQPFLFSDASATGVCTGGGSAYSVCVWNGASYAAIGGTSTGLGDPGANSVVYRNGSGTSIPATATQMSGPNFCPDAGSTDTYACNLSPVIASYVTGTLYWFKANTANTGAASINFNGKGALTIKKMQAAITTDLNDNDIQVGQWVGVLYDGTNAQMVSQLGNAFTPIADQRVLGNISGGTAIPIGITAAQVATFLGTSFPTGSSTTNRFAYWSGANALTGHQFFVNSASFDSPVMKNSYGALFYLHHTGSGPFYSQLKYDDSLNSNGGSGATRFDLVSAAGNTLSFSDVGFGWTASGFATLIASTQAALVTPSFSATPTFSSNSNIVHALTTFTLTGNVTSSTLQTTGLSVAELLSFTLCQDGTGGRTFVWPTNVLGGGTISATASACSRQTFAWDGSNANATGPMSLYTSGAVKTRESDLSLSDITTNNVSTSAHGFAPKGPNDATKYLDGTGAYSTPAGGNASVPSVGNITAVTANANSTSDQALQEIALPAGFLNTLKQQTIFNSSGKFTIAVAQTPTLTFKVKLCTVSGCGSGTVVTLASIVTAATVAATDNPWNMTLTAGTSATGATGTLIVHGFASVDIGALATAAESVYNDGNTAVSSTIDLTAALFVDWTITTSTGSAGNTFTEQNAGVMAPGGSPVSSVFGQTGAVGAIGDLSAVGVVIANAINSSKMVVVNTRRVCDILVGDTSGSAITSGQMGPQSRVCYIPAAATIVEMDVNADAGTPNVIVGVNHAGSISNIVSGALATAASGGIACSNTGGTTGINGATTCSSTLQNTSMVAGDYLELVSGTPGGTAKLFAAHVIYTVN